MIATELLVVAAEMSGRIEGGWGYVYASYGITWGTFVLYAASLFLRQKNLEQS